MHLRTLIPLILAASAAASPAIQARAACNRDNLLRCFAATPGPASAYCTSFVGGTTVTVRTTTPTTTVFSTAAPTSTIPSTTTTTTSTTVSTFTTTTTTTTPTAFSTVTVTTFVTITGTSSTTTFIATVTETSTITAQPIKFKRAAIDDLQARAAAGPACLTRDGAVTTSYPSSRISSACSCIGVTRTTVSATATAPTSTISRTTTIPTTTTSVSTVTITSFVTVPATTTITSTTTFTSVTTGTITETTSTPTTLTVSATTSTTTTTIVNSTPLLQCDVKYSPLDTTSPFLSYNAVSDREECLYYCLTNPQCLSSLYTAFSLSCALYDIPASQVIDYSKPSASLSISDKACPFAF